MFINWYFLFKVLKPKKELFIRQGWYFPGGSAVKNLLANAGDSGDANLIPGLRRALREENGNPLQYYCQRNLVDRGVDRL